MKNSLNSKAIMQGETKWLLSLSLALFMVVVTLFFDSPANIINDWQTIISSETQLTTDFVAVAGISATLFNSALTILVYLIVLFLYKIEITAHIAAALAMMAGFSMFGTHILNSLPIILGGILYVHIFQKDLQKEIFKILLASSLGPFVSFIALQKNISAPWNIICALSLGLLIGFVDIPIATNAPNLHQGYTLFNAGFTSGIISIMLTALLRFIGFEVKSRSLLSEGQTNTLAYVLAAYCILLIILSAYKISKNSDLDDYKDILMHSGHSVDYDAEFSPALANLNAGLTGLVCLIWVAILGGNFNGPVIGSIMSVMGFSLIGKTPRNILPILISVPLFNYLVGGDPSSTACLTATFLGSSLAPLAGSFGFFAGLVAGFLNAAVIVQMTPLQGGMNLYNNGLSTGLISAFLVPILQELKNKNLK